MKKLLVAAAVTSLIGTVNAQSAFEGAYGQLGVGYDNNNVSSSSLFNGTITVATDSANFGNFAGVVGLGYNFAINKQFLLGVGADYGFMPSSLSKASAQFSNTVGYKISQRYNIFLAPGYVLDKDRLAYLKVGYSSQYLNSTDEGNNSTRGQSVGSGNANGYVLGLGYKQMIRSGFYGFGEANYFNYSGASFASTRLSTGEIISNFSPKSSAYQFLVGVGYKF
jgi:outer membrane immunogenic protein